MLKEITDYLFHKSTLLLTRKQLGSIESFEFEDNEETERAMIQDLSNAYNAICWLEEKLVKEQKDFQAYHCQTLNQIDFSRGTINGFELIRDFIDANRELPESK